MPNFSAIRTNSATEPARIFSMTLLRWTLTVNSVVPSSAPISLLRRPVTTSASTSRSRWVKQVVPHTQFSDLTSVLSIYDILPDRLMNRIEQGLVAKGVGQKLNRPGLHRFYRHRDVAMAGDEDDRNRTIGRSQFALEIETAQSGQPYVENEARRRV